METTKDLVRYSFSEIFEKLPDGSLMPRHVIKINSVVISPGISFSKGIKIGGIDIFDYMNFDLGVDIVNDIFVIKGFYKK